MVLDGLSNNQGKYIPPSPIETQRHLKAKSKEAAQRFLENVDNSNDAELVKGINPDEEKQNKRQKQTLTIEKAKELLEGGDNNQEIELTFDDNQEDIELNYLIKFNPNEQVIEIVDSLDKKIVDTIPPDELLNVLTKAKSISGIFIDRKI